MRLYVMCEMLHVMSHVQCCDVCVFCADARCAYACLPFSMFVCLIPPSYVSLPSTIWERLATSKDKSHHGALHNRPIVHALVRMYEQGEWKASGAIAEW